MYRPVGFRALRSAAPLKLVVQRPAYSLDSCFRALRSAAPLKHLIKAENEQEAREFPRSSERGPIEARLLPPPGRSGQGAFPRSSERGPIEANSNSQSPSLAPWFPRSSERGPIEATGHISPVTGLMTRFRALRSAAPLKPGRVQAAAARLPGFRALRSAAPLKRRGLAEDPPDLVQVSALFGARPH